MFRPKEPTATSVVLAALVAADDFMTLPQVRASTGLDVNHASAALCHLRKYRAVAAIAQDGQLWWYATPADDTRSRVLDDRTPEARPRRPRRVKRRASAPCL